MPAPSLIPVYETISVRAHFNERSDGVEPEQALTGDGQLEVLPVAGTLERWLDLSA